MHLLQVPYYLYLIKSRIAFSWEFQELSNIDNKVQLKVSQQI